MKSNDSLCWYYNDYVDDHQDDNDDDLLNDSLQWQAVNNLRSLSRHENQWKEDFILTNLEAGFWIFWKNQNQAGVLVESKISYIGNAIEVLPIVEEG